MTNAKNTKRALWMSILSLLLCFTMLLGTTFAWFTDSVTSANNVIQSGNLDIELEYWDGDSWESVENVSNVLTNKLWEPGVTEVAYLRIANAGSLALKYQLGINVVEETEGVNAAGETFKLSDYIMFGVVENVNGKTDAYESREDAIAAVVDAKKISTGYTKAEAMTSGEELYLALVVYMPATVGNEANHNGTDIPEIKLGINVVATQYTYEKDSFDQYYDSLANPWNGEVDIEWYDAAEDEFVIDTPEKLAGLAALVNGTANVNARSAELVDFRGKTIKLAASVDMKGLAWTPIGSNANAFEGTFDGQGNTIYNLSIDASTTNGVGLFGVAQNATFKGVNLKNVSVVGYQEVAALVGRPYTGCEISDCHVSGDIAITAEYAYAGGIAGHGYVSIENCSVIGNDGSSIVAPNRNAVGGIIGWMWEGNYSITNCSVKNLDLIGWTNVGGITGFVHYNNTISGCSVEDVNLIKTRINGNPGIGLIAGGYSYSANNAITLNDNSVKNVSMSGTHIAYASYNELYGSEYGGATTANFVLENNTDAGVTNNLTVVSQDAASKLWQDADGVYYIGSADDLKAFANYVNSFSNYEYPFQGKTIVLTRDLDLGGAEWTPIGDYRFSANRFCGTFDGQGHTISNFQITKKTDKNDSNKSSYGFFGNVEGTVKNLTVANANVSSYAYCGALIGRLNGGLVENCHVIDSTVAPSYWQGGIMIGQVNGGSVKNCSVSNSSISGKSGLGGMFGPVTTESGDILFENCTVKDSAINQVGSFGGSYDKYFGGIAGYLESKNYRIDLNNCSVINTTIKGEISSLLSGDNDGNIYFNGVKGITSADELKAALNAGGNIVLGADIVLTQDIAISNANFVFDGNGYTITGTATTAALDINGGTATIKNVVFDGIQGGAAIRTVDVDLTAENVTVQNCEHTMVEGLVRLRGKNTVKNCTFKNNDCSLLLTLNFDGENPNLYSLVEGCTFEGNTCNGSAVVYYVKGSGATIANNKFIGNTVNCTKNGATVYMGFQENTVVTGNLFQNNTVIDSTDSTRVSGGIFFGYECVFEGNSFIGNKASNANGDALGNDVCVSTYYTDIDLSGNYWGGNAPVEGENYFVQHKTYGYVVILDSYIAD